MVDVCASPGDYGEMHRLMIFGVVVLAISACGGGENSCSAVSPCGGQIAPGRYRISSYCSNLKATIKSAVCPAGLTVDVGSMSATGTFTFNADGTYQAEATLTGSIVESVPSSCLRQASPGSSCSQLGQQQLRVAGSAVLSSGCSGTETCACSFSLGNLHSLTNGTWSTNGAVLTITPSNQRSSRSQYCATASTVSLVSTSTTDTLGGSLVMEELMGAANMVLTRE